MRTGRISSQPICTLSRACSGKANTVSSSTPLRHCRLARLFYLSAPMATRKKAEPVERTETCKSCRHCHHVKEAIECRRYPPTVTYDGSTGFFDYRFPEVAVIQWCGEYAPQLSS